MIELFYKVLYFQDIKFAISQVNITEKLKETYVKI